MMSKIAVAIVILPPENIGDLAIRLNQDFSKLEKGKVVLGKNDGEAMPHMTLAMGVVAENSIDEIGKELGDILENLILPTLEIDGIDILKVRDDILAPCLGIKKIVEIQKLHERLNADFENIFLGDASREMFYIPPSVSMEEFSYINNFYAIAGGEKFYPHFTIGYWKNLGKVDAVFPVKFRAAKIAICHLGDYYTCRKILWSRDLK